MACAMLWIFIFILIKNNVLGAANALKKITQVITLIKFNKLVLF